MLKKQVKKLRLGDLLLQQNVISDAQLKMALDEQKRSGKRLGDTFVDLGFIGEEKLLEILSEHMNVPFVDLKHFQFNNELIQKLPETKARRFRAIVLAEENNGLLVGMTDPMDLYAIDEMQRHLNSPVYPAVIKEVDLLHTLDTVYRRTEEISNIASELEDELGDHVDFDLDTLTADAGAADAPVVRLLQSIFEDAVQVKASDIHIEPDEHVLRVRQRIDGVLHEQVMKEKRVAQALVLRLKIMSSLDISEKRIPQDGRFNIKVKDKSIDVRLSTMPVQYGESVVMRLLDQSEGVKRFKDLGLAERIAGKLEVLVRRPHGMILVTGPTGSGKTTTLYSILNELNQAEKKIITAEDPVEYRLSRISQVQVNPKVGLTFSKVLRAALRQDPDIVLVGEMRDQETATIGLRAAMTGHLVFSTLHTNDAVSTAIRLIDMGAEPYLTATALCAVVAQRLVRKVCKYCAQSYEPTVRELGWIDAICETHPEIRGDKFVKGRGCHHCANTGYAGRIGVHELLEMNEDLADALRRNNPSEFSKVALSNPEFFTLSQSAFELAVAGVTSLEEVFRISSELVDASFEPDVEDGAA